MLYEGEYILLDDTRENIMLMVDLKEENFDSDIKEEKHSDLEEKRRH